ncbi:MAG: cupin domain-containing protein [Euryarchaeota archaeon]|nr:cupin domain-containing protein [Euryarchaeota archaeon]
MIVRSSSAEPFITKDGSLVRELVHPKNSSAERLSLAEARVKPGDRTREHLHRKSEEVYYILSGEGEVYLNGKGARVEAGDAVLIPPGTRHYVVNTGEEELVILCACSPPYSHEDTLITG